MIIGTKQYAEVRGISDGYVRYCIIHQKELPGVLAHQKVGKTHLLTVDIPVLAKHVGIPEKKLTKMLVL